MILCIDAGNTATKVAAVSRDGVLARGTLATADLIHDPALITALSDVLRESGEVPDAVAIASVVDGAVDAARAAIAGIAIGAPLLIVDHSARLPIRLSLSHPETVGADRLCAAAGAVDEDHPHAIVVDVGSAVTVDRVRGLEFTGGAIMPGPQMMLDALREHTSRLPSLALADLDSLFPEQPRSTVLAMALGAGAATAGGIREAVRRLSGHDERLPVWVTGGQSAVVDAELPPGWIREPDLTVLGLYRCAIHALSVDI